MLDFASGHFSDPSFSTQYVSQYKPLVNTLVEKEDFRALGWNVEDSEEVTAEEKISRKRVDCAFRIDGIPKLFLEAKSLK